MRGRRGEPREERRSWGSWPRRATQAERQPRKQRVGAIHARPGYHPVAASSRLERSPVTMVRRSLPGTPAVAFVGGWAARVGYRVRTLIVRVSVTEGDLSLEGSSRPKAR